MIWSGFKTGRSGKDLACERENEPGLCCNQPGVRSSLRGGVLLSGGFADGCIETAVLLTSEVVTNAVVHGRSDIELVVTADHPMARVQVYDAEPSLPVRRSPSEQAERGRGVHVIDALAEAWGVEQLLDGAGKCVWFEMRS